MDCKATPVGAIPTRDSISSGIGVDRHTSVFQTEIERALLSCPSTFPSESGPPAETPHGRSNGRVPDSVRLGFFFATRTPVPVRTSQAWLRWFNSAFAFAFGLQALQRCSGLLNRRARGGTVATHHFADVAQQRQQQFCKLPGIAPRECESLRRPHFASVVKLLSSSASNGEFAGGSPAGCTKIYRRVSPTEEASRSGREG